MKKRYIFKILTLFMMLSCLVFNNKARASSQNWNTAIEVVSTVDGVTYYAYISSDNKECWIHRIQINVKTDTVHFPAQINGVVVTKVGSGRDLISETADDELYIDIFGKEYDMGEGIAKFSDKRIFVKNVILPENLADICEAAFVGFKKIESVIIPDSVSSIDKYTFMMCSSLKEVKLPQKLEQIESTAFDKCKNLKKIKFEEPSDKYKVKNNMLLSKDEKTLYFVATGIKNANIPKGIKRIVKAAFLTSYADKITLPASVNELEQDSLSLKKAPKVILHKNNRTFVKKNDGIYNKQTGSLACIIAGDNEVVIPEKVKEINEEISVMGRSKVIKKIVLPTSLKKLSGAWTRQIYRYKSVCFKGTKPPITKASKAYPGYEVKPVFCTVYVPKKAKKQYIKWRLKGENDLDIDELWNKVVSY